MRKGLRLLGATPVAVGPSVAENEENLLWNRTLVIPNWYDSDLFRPPSRRRGRLRASHTVYKTASPSSRRWLTATSGRIIRFCSAPETTPEKEG